MRLVRETTRFFFMNDSPPPDLSTMTIGFIGLGLMGRPMAANLHQAGATLVVVRRAASLAAEISAERIKVVETPSQVAEIADLVILMLPNADAVVTVCTGPEGLASAVGAESTVMDMGTTDGETTLAMAARFQEAGAAYVDAPVTGGRIGATKGALTIFVGTEDASGFDAVKPVLDAMGANITRMGPVGSGQAAKAVNQLINFSSQVVLAEGMALARRTGLDLNLLIPALAGGAADSVILQILGPRMAAEDWSVTAHMEIAVKDMDMVQESARAKGLSVPMTDLARARWSEAAETIGPEHDIAEIVRLVDPKFSGGGWHQGGDSVGSGTGK